MLGVLAGEIRGIVATLAVISLFLVSSSSVGGIPGSVITQETDFLTVCMLDDLDICSLSTSFEGICSGK